ncbi:MAG: ATP-dependent Clp protease ATP-binding subunit [Candidatus Sungbacteria bacterium]|nr:ATP-dependent Clp protease ATP-binding subunit [Candidatus Sungbacteria bacterium]
MSLQPLKFIGVLVLDRLFPKKIRAYLDGALNFAIQLACLYAGYVLLPEAPAPVSLTKTLGVLLLLMSVRLLLLALDAFAHAQTWDYSGDAAGASVPARLTYRAADIWYAAAGSFFRIERVAVSRLSTTLAASEVGRNVLLRLGMRPVDYIAGVASPRAPNITSENLAIPLLATYMTEKKNTAGEISLADLLTFLFDTDESFKGFLLGRQIRKEDLVGACQWIERSLALADRKSRWWSRKNLGRIQGIGKKWSFGYTVFLEQFCQPLRLLPTAGKHELIGKQAEVELLQSALLKTNGANVMIIGEPGIGKRTVLEGLARMIDEGKVFPDLEHKQVLELSAVSVLGTGKTKGETEALLLRVFNEAAAARNIIFAIDDFPEFIESLENLGTVPGTLLGPYLASPRLHVIALGTTASFRRILEREKGLVSEFTKIELAEPSHADLIAIIQDTVPALEEAAHHRIMITYPAVAAIAEGVEHYLLSGGGIPERAVNLLEEAAHESISRQSPFCTQEIILEYLKKKTHIPLGAIEQDEKEKLLNLEDELHKRVINQKDAIAAIANAIRRARAAMSDSRRPIGTFLFLGPTGVGKTETAKALAAVYFGNADAMTRFDMTEYQSEEGLTRLIGSSAANQQGMLASAIRSTPYAVVLLDEFEKSYARVQDLFLQILDEGFFTDGFGERVSMRNCIIIATSNAGSVFILDALEKKTPVNEMQTAVISYIQSNGIFKPELLNRFDSVIVFTPLGPEELKQVSRLMLESLAARLKKQNLDLAVTDELISATATGGYSATFGARPMRRFIQDRIEKIIADRIIAGSLKDGDTITLTAEDLKM